MCSKFKADRTAAKANQEPGRIYCRVCGRPVHTVVGRGRKKEIHKTCTIVSSRLAELERLIATMEFSDQAYANQLRGDLFRIANGPLQNGHVTINATSDQDI